jgi:hypothetical protein
MSGIEQQLADTEKQLADTAKQLVDANEYANAMREDMQGLREDVKVMRETNKELNTTVTKLQETVEDLQIKSVSADKGVTCTDLSLSTLFEELDTHYIVSYVENNLPSDMIEILSDHGLKTTTQTLVGSKRFNKYFSETYPEMLEEHFKHDTETADETTKLELESHYKVALSKIKAIGDEYAKDAADSLKKVKSAKHAALKENDKEGMKRAKDTETIILKGLYWHITKKFRDLEAKTKKLRSAGEVVPPDLTDQVELFMKFASRRKGANEAYIRKFGYAGTFFAYLYSIGLDVSDVDVDVVKSYRIAMAKVRSIREATVTAHSGTITDFCKFLVGEQVNKHRCKYLPPLGKIPKYIPPASEKDLPREAFYLGVELSRSKVVSVSSDMSKIYGKLHIAKASKIPAINKDLPLLEICLRIARETGLRYTFLKAIRWGHFRTDKKDAQSTDGKLVYRLDLVNTEEEVKRGLYSLKSIVSGQKEIPNNDFLRISRKLRNQIVAYRNDPKHKDVMDTDYVFDRCALLGLPRTPTNTASYLSIGAWRGTLLEGISKISGVDVSIVPMTFRNSYYTLMLKALRGDLAFKDWTGDDRDTANTNYKAVSTTIKLPPVYEGSLTYNEIVTRIFDNE